MVSGVSRSAVAPLELQLSWHERALHLWAIDPATGEAAHLVDVMHLVDDRLGRDVSLAGSPARMPVTFPGGTGTVVVATLRTELWALGEISPRETSPTLRWFHDLATLVHAAAASGRVRPTLVIDGPVHVARWQLLVDDELTAALAELAARLPAACGVEDLDTCVADLVDRSTREHLGDQGWRPPHPRYGRGREYRAAQAAFRALASASGNVLYRNDDIDALAELSRSLARHAERSAGLPVVRAQLRVHLPDGRDDAWTLSIEACDVDQPERWCTLADVVAGSSQALDLARRHDRLPRVGERIVEAGRLLAEHLGPSLAGLKSFAEHPAEPAELDLAEVESFLAAAPATLEQLDIGLIGPEQLLRATVGLRAVATPRPPGIAGNLSAAALVEWNASIDDTPIDDAQLERAASAGRSLIHVNGRWVRLDGAQLRTTLDRLRAHRSRDAELDVGALMALAATTSAGVGDGSAVELDSSGWIAELLAGLPDDRLVELREPEGFGGELRHYQRRGLSWMGFLARIGLGGCLADDMGLGKTATTLAHLATRPGPHLVICPLSVVHNWSAEAARFTPQLQVSVHHGNERARGERASEQLLPADIVVTTYGLLGRDIDTLASVRWSTLVLDEAQAVKNHLTRAAKAVRQIRADQRLALTGTPVENHLGELWSILDAVNPGLYGSAAQFTDRYARPIQRDADPVATAALRTLTQPFLLRRTKADKTLLPELPDKIEQIAWSTLTREQATMYQAVVDQLLADAQAATGIKRRGLVLAALTRLKQICNHPAHALGDGSRLDGRSGKLTRFDELVDDLLVIGERALVFTQFREMGLLLQRHLRERVDLDAAFLHGGVSRTGRDAMVQRFQAGDGAPLLLVSLKAGGTGLNLTRASQVIHYDRWWNPAVEDQATDRAWRLGQARTVLVHKMVCEGTLEERISQLIGDKRRLANSVLDTGEQWLTELSTDELRSLVSLSDGTGRRR